MRSFAVLGAVCGFCATLGCRTSAGPVEHPDDPVFNPPATQDDPEPTPTTTQKPAPQGVGIAYAKALVFELARGAVPCPDACSKGDERARCSVHADVRFLDLQAEGSHRQVRSVLEQASGIDECFTAVNQPDGDRLLSFRIPLDFVIGPEGKLETQDDPLHDEHPELEQMLGCVGTWLGGLEFEGAGRSLEARVRLSIEPTTRCDG